MQIKPIDPATHITNAVQSLIATGRPDTTALEQAISDYLQQQRRDGVKPITIKNYRSMVGAGWGHADGTSFEVLDAIETEDSYIFLAQNRGERMGFSIDRRSIISGMYTVWIERGMGGKREVVGHLCIEELRAQSILIRYIISALDEI
jgi:hypothetical protein